MILPFRAEHVREREKYSDVIDLYWTDPKGVEIFVGTILLPKPAAEEFAKAINHSE